MHTPLRNVRIPDDLWQEAKTAAHKQGTTVSEVIRTKLVDWLIAQKWRP